MIQINTISPLWDIILLLPEKQIDDSLLIALLDNNPDIVSSLLHTSQWSIMELMMIIIYAEHTTFDTWDLLLPLLSLEDMKTVFYVPFCNQYVTLLYYTLLTSRDIYSDHTKCQIKRFIDYGADLNQMVDEKTLLSYVVNYNPYNHSSVENSVSFVAWCMEQGADHHLGHLLIYSCNYDMSLLHKTRSLPIKKITYDVVLYQYLLSIGCDRNDRLENGYYAIEAVCNEGNIEKVTLFLETEIDLYLPLSCWTYGLYHRSLVCDEHTLWYPILSQLQTYHYKQYDTWKKIVKTIEIISKEMELELLSYVMLGVPIP